MLVAVTGAGGHLGANVVRDLLDHDAEVVAIDLHETIPVALQGLAVTYRSANVLNPSDLRNAFQGVDVVIHLAAVISIDGDPSGLVMRTNVKGPRNVAGTCLEMGIRKLVHVSSIHAFKISRHAAKVDETTAKADEESFIYDQSKSAGEREVKSAAEKGLDATIINPTGILGPHDYAPSLAGQMLRKHFLGTMPALVDAGFDWIDVRDVATTIRTAISHGKSGEQYVLSGEWISFKELAILCEKATGIPPPRLTLPIGLAFLGLPFSKLFNRLTNTPQLFSYESLKILRESNKNCCSDKARQELGFKSRPLSETITDTFEWNRRNGFI